MKFCLPSKTEPKSLDNIKQKYGTLIPDTEDVTVFSFKSRERLYESYFSNSANFVWNVPLYSFLTIQSASWRLYAALKLRIKF